MNDQDVSDLLDQELDRGREAFEQLADASWASDASALERMVEGGMAAGPASVFASTGAKLVVGGLVVLVAAVGIGVLASSASDEPMAKETDPVQQAVGESTPGLAQRDQLDHLDPLPVPSPVEVETAPPQVSETLATERAEDEPPVKKARREPQPSAAEMLLEASRLARTGKRSQAREAFERLEKTYPDSREHQIGRVGRGDLELKAKRYRRALSQYRAYLDDNPDGRLAREALYGTIQALDGLGQSKEADEARQQLLDAYPDSIHAASVRKDLED